MISWGYFEGKRWVKKKDLEQALTSLVLLPSLPVNPPLPPTTAAGGANHDRSLAEDRMTTGG